MFLFKKLYLSLIWTGKNGFAIFFVFTTIFVKRVANDYAVTMSELSTTTRTRTRLCEHCLKTVKASHRFKGTIRWQKVLGCVNSNNLKIWKCLYLKKNLRVGVVVDYTETRFSNIFAKTKMFTYLFSPLSKKGRKSSETVPLITWHVKCTLQYIFIIKCLWDSYSWIEKNVAIFTDSELKNFFLTIAGP